MLWWCAAGTWDHDAPPPGFNVYVSKSITLNERPQVGPERRIELPDQGYVNKIGVVNPGIYHYLNSMPQVPDRARLVTSLLGRSMHEWMELIRRARKAGIEEIELNMSCPNIEHGGRQLNQIETIVRVVMAAEAQGFKTIGVKLGPEVINFHNACIAAEVHGATYICISNTLRTRRGGISGRPLRAFALEQIAMATEVLRKTPIVGGGGLMDRDDAQLYLDAGATDVFMGTANIIGGSRP